MAWARVDDGWWCHPKVVGLDLDARGLWISALAWSCQQQTEVIPTAIVAMCGGDEQVAGKLVAAGLWEPRPDGYRIHDWDDYQSERAKKADAGRQGGRRSGESRRRSKHDHEADDGASYEADASASAEADPAGSGEAGPARPDPTRPDQTASSPPAGGGTTTSVDGESDADDPSDDTRIVESFERFWAVYPARHGRKVAKGKALTVWRRLTWEQRRRAFIGAQNLAASGQLPRDAHRFLRRDTGGEFPFDDWQQPPAADPDRVSDPTPAARNWGARLADAGVSRDDAAERASLEWPERPEAVDALLDGYDTQATQLHGSGGGS